MEPVPPEILKSANQWIDTSKYLAQWQKKINQSTTVSIVTVHRTLIEVIHNVEDVESPKKALAELRSSRRDIITETRRQARLQTTEHLKLTQGFIRNGVPTIWCKSMVQCECFISSIEAKDLGSLSMRPATSDREIAANQEFERSDKDTQDAMEVEVLGKTTS